MNEILFRRYVNQVTKQGVPILMAKEIVETALEASKGRDVDTYIEYALKLVYGMNFALKVNAN